MLTYADTTRDITVTVRPIYLDEPTDFFEREFAFGYAISVENQGSTRVRLVRQRWTVRNTDGAAKNDGTDVALRTQPVLNPGEQQVYGGSWTLPSFGGSVEGNFLVRSPDGEEFQVSIPSVPLRAAAN
jgi:ApaG protein